ncbi:DNA/RNA non-specific endonuclease [Mucilaginibacter sp. AW1-7]|uniref:DNA/RNA non-specific endonuclease n=1 Tax=Mucilaginibacter sp. AW1-7 TaxID=3349874 RepID=UPI003F74013B
MKPILRFSFLFVAVSCYGLFTYAQRVDKVIDIGIYKSYYSFAIKNPLYVTYKLYKGGGPCDRNVEHFSFAQCGEQTATNDDYTNSQYERGHLANAEDFAGSCSVEKKTFCYYNCVPQTTELNHGKWLEWEGRIRDMSKTKHLFIVAGSIFKDKRIKPGNTVRVPEACYKIVIDEQTGARLLCMIFPNDKSKSGRDIDFIDLKAMLTYPLVPQNELSRYQ